MPVKVMIKRIVPESKVDKLQPLLLQMRTLATQQPGYISGETLKRIDDPGQNLVISTWQSVDAWRQWVLNEERAPIQNQIDTLLGHETVYEIYAY